MIKKINSDLCHLGLFPEAEKKLRFTPDVDFASWKKEVREKFITLLGIDRIAKNACELNVEIEEEVQMDGYRRIRFTFESEKGAVVPCYLLVPDDAGEKKYPVAITQQGHSSGFHNSVGIPKSEADEAYQQDRGMFGVQAVEHGFISLCLEQRGMGESISATQEGKEKPKKCIHTAMTALALGRTILGERVWDISRAIDVLKSFEHLGLDLDKILITGNSGGGTISFYAACYDERIKFSAPSCAFCSYLTSILNVPHCSCNYIPSAFKWFDMQDLACLIAPRKLAIVAGKYDTAFLVNGVKRGYETVKQIYEKEGVKDNKGQLDEKLEWVRNMLDVQKELSDSEEFMKTLKIDLFTDEIFVFTPKGDVVNLPIGSCPIDLAYAIHSEVGNKMIGAKINGKIVTIDQELQTGDIVQILTTPTSKGPSLDWLKIVKTSQARSKINQWHKAHNREQHILKGKELIDKEIRRAEIPNMNEFKEEFTQLAMKKFSIRNPEDMYATVGFEGALSNKIIVKLKDELKKLTSGEEDKQIPFEHKKKKRTSDNGVTVRGIDNCLVRLSKCCNPVPGDDIVGYITRGRGVSVHRADCVNAINTAETEKTRMIEVSWDVTDSNTAFVADVQVSAINRANLVYEIAADLSNMNIPIVGMNARVVKDNMAAIEVAIEVKNGQQLAMITNKLKSISGVYDVKRYNN